MFTLKLPFFCNLDTNQLYSSTTSSYLIFVSHLSLPLSTLVTLLHTYNFGFVFKLFCSLFAESSSSSSLLVCLLSFLTGAALASAVFYVWQKRQKPKLPSSPHYITSKQNPYVTVPMKEYRTLAKRTPSFTKSTTVGVQNGNGTLPKLFNKSADYETATIKRNSHSLVNGHMRANRPDLEQEKFF